VQGRSICGRGVLKIVLCTVHYSQQCVSLQDCGSRPPHGASGASRGVIAFQSPSFDMAGVLPTPLCRFMNQAANCVARDVQDYMYSNRSVLHKQPAHAVQQTYGGW
jgi:hypothetical protein